MTYYEARQSDDGVIAVYYGEVRICICFNANMALTIVNALNLKAAEEERMEGLMAVHKRDMEDQDEEA